MKQKLKMNWPWLVVALGLGLLCATYLLAQRQNGGAPVASEDDAQLLVAAMAAGDYQTALEVLHAHGVAEQTLLAMAERIGQLPVRMELGEPFMRGTVSLPWMVTTDEFVEKAATAEAMGYGRLFWVAKSLNPGWESLYDSKLELFPQPPVGVLDFTLGDPNLIEFFKWYDRYADQLHSVVLNWTHLSNHTQKNGYVDVNRTLNALYKLIKARNPDAFVWLGVVKKDDRSDEPWLRAMTFRADGLLIWNLRQFHSPFEETRRRFVSIVGADMPMVVASFQGYKQALVEKGERLVAANSAPESPQQALDRAKARAELGKLGKIVDNNLSQQEEKLYALGYSGLTVHWMLLEAVANKDDSLK